MGSSLRKHPAWTVVSMQSPRSLSTCGSTSEGPLPKRVGHAVEQLAREVVDKQVTSLAVHHQRTNARACRI
jgi:hypothetical protein